ncbi:MAG: DEAD/DEAH box helicase [Planctomycetota bacterium]
MPLPDGFLLPVVRAWFTQRFREPTAPQEQGWRAIAAGDHTLIAAPTGMGKTLAAFLHALDALLRQGDALPEQTQVLYISPLRALGNDIRKNLAEPLQQLRDLDPQLPEVRVTVRTGDTPASEREAMKRRPPHILVTTPESLYLLLSNDGGRRILSTVRTVIVDEIHAIVGDKRGSHMALSLERLEHLVGAGKLQRIGLSATQRPIAATANFLVGVGRACTIVDTGHLRQLDLRVEVPSSPLEAVCAQEVWAEIYARIVELIKEHRTTVVFVNTRKQAERFSKALQELMGEDAVTCHHSSLSKEHRLAAEQRLKAGELQAIVATASLELGIDIGEIDLVVQVGVCWAIATFLQRVGRSGHVLGKIPKGRMFPLTRQELVAATALFEAVRAGELDEIPQPRAPLDVLAQQIIAACVSDDWDEAKLYRVVCQAWPFKDLTRDDFDATIALHTEGRFALLHRDGVGARVLGTKRARLVAIQNGGTIPDNAEYQVVENPTGHIVGTVDEDFAIEASIGDIFQLGSTSWQILQVRSGVIHVADAGGMPPTLPFWFGEAPGRTRELSVAVSSLLEAGGATTLPEEEAPASAREQVQEFVAAGSAAIGCIPTQQRIVAERFFDETGGMQLVLHSPFGVRINRAWGLTLRKRFCRGFGFELQAAANDDAVLISLGQQHSFPLAEVFDYLHPETARGLLEQALLDTPLFETRWRWNVANALLVQRRRNGKRVPAPLQRFRAEDLLQKAFPQVLACFETLPPGDLPIPMEHPMVRQTIDDCMQEAMDVDGFLALLRGIHDATIETVAIDTPKPSVFCEAILNAAPYAFLDDAPLEERRARAMARGGSVSGGDHELGALDPAAVARVRDEAWPTPESAEEVHEALCWMGFVADDEAPTWAEWLQELLEAGRVQRDCNRWFATEASRVDVDVWRGRLQALALARSDDAALLKLEGEGSAIRARYEAPGDVLREWWCDRRLLARIRRYTVERLRSEIAPVPLRDFLRYLACWQHVAPGFQLEGPRGVGEVAEQLAGLEIPAARWEREVLPRRVRQYLPEWTDDLCTTGRLAWGRLWGGSKTPIRTTPIAFLPRQELPLWTDLAKSPDDSGIGGATRQVRDLLTRRGALFSEDLQREGGLLESQVEMALGELIARGAITCDSFSGLRKLLFQHRRRRTASTTGRWSLFKGDPDPASPGAMPSSTTAGKAPQQRSKESLEFIAMRLLRRTGVVFRRLLQREKLPVTWRELLRIYRRLELQGVVRGGRFVSGVQGEQFALPEAVTLLRRVRKVGDEWVPVTIAPADPLNYTGILLPGERVSPTSRSEIVIH